MLSCHFFTINNGSYVRLCPLFVVFFFLIRKCLVCFINRLQRTKESVVSSKDRSVLSLLSSAGSLGNSSYGAGCSSAESSISNNHDNILLGDQQHTGGHIVTTAAKGGSIEGLNQEIERLVLRSSIAGRQLDRQHVKVNN